MTPTAAIAAPAAPPALFACTVFHDGEKTFALRSPTGAIRIASARGRTAPDVARVLERIRAVYRLPDAPAYGRWAAFPCTRAEMLAFQTIARD